MCGDQGSLQAIRSEVEQSTKLIQSVKIVDPLGPDIVSESHIRELPSSLSPTSPSPVPRRSERHTYKPDMLIEKC